MPTDADPGAQPPAAPDASPTVGYDGGRPWALDPQVALRPEPFGALAYHFGTRRLSFLKSRQLLRTVESLADHPTGDAACAAAGVEPGDMPAYRRALGALASSGMIRARGSS